MYHKKKLEQFNKKIIKRKKTQCECETETETGSSTIKFCIIK